MRGGGGYAVYVVKGHWPCKYHVKNTYIRIKIYCILYTFIIFGDTAK